MTTGQTLSSPFILKLQRCELARANLFAVVFVLALTVFADAQGEFVIGAYSINRPSDTDYQGIDSIGCEYLYLFAYDEYLDDAFSLSGDLKLFQAVLALLLGNILATPVRALRHQMPYYLGIFNPRQGLFLMLATQAFRILSLLAAGAAFILLAALLS